MVFSGFVDISEHPVRSGNPIWILNGVVGCGLGVLFNGFVLLGFPRSIRGLWFVDNILCIFMTFSGFGDPPKHSVRFRNLIHVPNGVFRCGFGLLFVGFVRILDFRTIRCVW